MLLLQRTGLAVESAPLRRAIQEHVVALKWVAVEGSKAMDPILRLLANTAEYRRETMRAAGWLAAELEGIDEIIANGEAAQQDKELDTYASAFIHMVDGYGNPSDYTGWSRVRRRPTSRPAHPYPWRVPAQPGRTLRCLRAVARGR